MLKGVDPSKNLLAQAGFITNEAGRIFEASCGRLDLPWLLDVSKEDARQARLHFQNTKTVDQPTRFGWFIASTESEFVGLKHLLEEDWRRALKSWKGGAFFQVHNRATLHRALFFSSQSERPEAHLRECLRLYYHLSELDPKQTYYRSLQEELIDHLKQAIRKSHRAGDDESASRSLKILAQTVGMVAVSHLQEQFFAKEIQRIRRDCARVQKELLAYQGLAHAPPGQLLDDCACLVSEQVIPAAARFTHKLVEGSKERKLVEETVAQTCGVVAKSHEKAGDSRGAKKWMGEAVRWEPEVVEDWAVEDDDFEEEEAAVITFPEQREEKRETPTPRGTKMLGVQSMVVVRELGDTREEWVESLFAAFLPIFPLRRFAAYRNPDTMEVGSFIRIPMTAWDHVRQGMVILALTFGFVVGGFVVSDAVRRANAPSGEETIAIKSQIEKNVEELKKLAQREASLTASGPPKGEKKKELESLRSRRLELIKELEELERRK